MVKIMILGLDGSESGKKVTVRVWDIVGKVYFLKRCKLKLERERVKFFIGILFVKDF